MTPERPLAELCDGQWKVRKHAVWWLRMAQLFGSFQDRGEMRELAKRQLSEQIKDWQRFQVLGICNWPQLRES